MVISLAMTIMLKLIMMTVMTMMVRIEGGGG